MATTQLQEIAKCRFCEEEVTQADRQRLVILHKNSPDLNICYFCQILYNIINKSDTDVVDRIVRDVQLNKFKENKK